MANTIKCPHCGKIVEITEALRHEIKVEVDKELEKKIRNEFEEELSEKNKKLREMQEVELSLRKEKRAVEEQKQSLELDVQRKIDEERQKIEQESLKKFDEEHKLKDLEKDKKISDLVKALEEAKRKGEQGSQQTQGEVFELELEKILRNEFPADLIKEVPKGIRGADLIQVVIDKFGRTCGSIIWEVKNAKWSDSWISKLKEDQRLAKANISILVTANLPKSVTNFKYLNGVWLTKSEFAQNLAHALRITLAQVFMARESVIGKNEKMEDLFKYVTGDEFKQRVSAIIESYTNLQTEIEKEKRWFSLKWARQEKEIRKVIDHTHGMYGELQGVVGAQSLPSVKGLELESGE